MTRNDADERCISFRATRNTLLLYFEMPFSFQSFPLISFTVLYPEEMLEKSTGVDSWVSFYPSFDTNMSCTRFLLHYVLNKVMMTIESKGRKMFW